VCTLLHVYRRNGAGGLHVSALLRLDRDSVLGVRSSIREDPTFSAAASPPFQSPLPVEKRAISIARRNIPRRQLRCSAVVLLGE